MLWTVAKAAGVTEEDVVHVAEWAVDGGYDPGPTLGDVVVRDDTSEWAAARRLVTEWTLAGCPKLEVFG